MKPGTVQLLDKDLIDAPTSGAGVTRVRTVQSTSPVRLDMTSADTTPPSRKTPPRPRAYSKRSPPRGQLWHRSPGDPRRRPNPPTRVRPTTTLAIERTYAADIGVRAAPIAVTISAHGG